jgi:hypothetical protein
VRNPGRGLFDDYLAPGLAGREGLALRERLQAELPPPFIAAFSRSVCVRARLPRTSWMYLTLDAISATLATMAGCPAGSRVVLTYNQPPALLGGTTAQIAAAFAGIAGAQRLVAATVMPARAVDGKHA